MTQGIEKRVRTDSRTGATVVQWTDRPSIHHHPFFYVPAYSADGRFLVFVSHRTGRPQIYTVERESGAIEARTERDDLGEWSLHPGWDANFIVYVAGKTGYRLDLDSGEETPVADFSAAAGMRAGGMVAAGMGVTGLSHCDRWWAVRLTEADGHALAIIDLETGKNEIVLRRDEIGHLSFCPDDASLLFVARTLTDRVWLVRRDGSEHRRLYARRPGEWITHETWIPGTGELAFVHWPHGIQAIHPETGILRWVARFHAWHASCSRDGAQMVADTTFPDTGLQRFDPRGAGEPTTLCFPGASNAGAHWGRPFPYEDGPVAVYAPQHTHPHPSFSPDGRHVVFTSDRTGFAQIYEVEVPA